MKCGDFVKLRPGAFGMLTAAGDGAPKAMLKKHAEAACSADAKCHVEFLSRREAARRKKQHLFLVHARPLPPCLILADVIPDYLMKFPKIGNPFDTGMLDLKPIYIIPAAAAWRLTK